MWRVKLGSGQSGCSATFHGLSYASVWASDLNGQDTAAELTSRPNVAAGGSGCWSVLTMISIAVHRDVPQYIDMPWFIT